LCFKIKEIKRYTMPFIRNKKQGDQIFKVFG